MKKNKGFTLIELMIVVAIIGILSAIIFPNYTSYMTKLKRSEGRNLLLQIMQQQQRYFTEELTYITDLTTLGYSYDASGKTPSDDGYYLVSARTCTSQPITLCVKLTAEPQGTHSSDGNLTLDSLGTKTPILLWQ